jgi:hypothetical protein
MRGAEDGEGEGRWLSLAPDASAKGLIFTTSTHLISMLRVCYTFITTCFARPRPPARRACSSIYVNSNLAHQVQVPSINTL